MVSEYIILKLLLMLIFFVGYISHLRQNLQIRQHLAQINFQSGVTRTGYALRKAEAELFRSDRGAR